jgi:hypothetical protein
VRRGWNEDYHDSYDGLRCFTSKENASSEAKNKKFPAASKAARKIFYHKKIHPIMIICVPSFQPGVA